jgi:hypothetical protein
MVEIKANLSVQIPGGPQVNVVQNLQLESYQYFDINLEKTHPEGVVPLTDFKKYNLILIKATFTLKDSKSKLMYKIGDAGTSAELDAPLLLLGSWVGFMVKDGKLKMTFELKPVPTDPKDTVKIEIITGWQDVDTPPSPTPVA